MRYSKKINKNAEKKIKLGKNVKLNMLKDRPGHDIRYALNSSKLKSKINGNLELISKGLRKNF